MKIFKYPIAVADEQVIEMPFGAEIISVANQNDVICLWAIVDPNSTDKKDVTVQVIGTGKPMPPVSRFVGTVLKGPFVWHVFADD